MKYGIVVSEFNSQISEALLEACLKGFKEQGIKPDVFKVPGALEIPLKAKDYIEQKYPGAVVALGCIVKGETDHYETISRMCGQGVMDVMLKTHTPIIFEVLMMDDIKKAKTRIQKGYEAAFTAVHMSKLIRKVS